MQISRAHRAKAASLDGTHRNSQNRPIIAQFVNWRVAEEVRNRLVHLYYQILQK